MYVVCVRTGDKYSTDYVEALRRQVEKHLGQELICLGDDVPLRYDFEGWWAKMELFSPEFTYRPCVYFDLDTYIMDDCRDLLIDTDELWLVRDFNDRKRSNSGMMIIPEVTNDIWENRPEHLIYRRAASYGDGDYLTKKPHRILQDHFEGIVSYKRHAREQPTGRIICFHGFPKPSEAKGWAGDYWKMISAGS